jgi:gas vesicle protein
MMTLAMIGGFATEAIVGILGAIGTIMSYFIGARMKKKELDSEDKKTEIDKDKMLFETLHTQLQNLQERINILEDRLVKQAERHEQELTKLREENKSQTLQLMKFQLACHGCLKEKDYEQP